MGGYVAFEFWNRHAELLSKLILCDTRAAADTVETAKGRQLAAHQVLAEGNTTLSQSMVPKLLADRTAAAQPDIVQRLRSVINQTAPATVAAALRGMAVRSDFTDRLGEIDLPVLLLCGSDDVITPAKEMKALAEALPSARYVEVEQAGHMAPLEQPATVNEAIAAFLRV
jgi:pimeloyl-ACP methyl ester carboxylesterase